MAGFPLGIWTSVFGISAFVQCYFIVTWIYTAGIGIALIFENRYYHISGRNGVWRQYRVPFIVLNYFLNITFLIPAMSKVPEQSEALGLVFEQLPSLSAEIKTYPIYVLSNEYFWVLFPFYFMAVLVIGESFVFCGLIYRNLNSNYGITRSRNTTTLQKKFLRAMYSQVAVLVFSFVFPALYVTFAMIFNYYNQSGNNIVFIILALHGISSTVVMLWAHKPYRTVCLKLVEELQLKVRLLSIPQERRPPRIVISVVF
ncbi:unnamed protein product [Caenorhabditis brenneri]